MSRSQRRAIRPPGPLRARRLAAALILACVLPRPASAQPANVDDALRSITGPRLRAHVAFLADDLLEGRAPGSRGGRIAARYIAAHYQRAGLQPPGGGWFQPVPLVGWRADPSRTSLEAAVDGRRIPLSYPDEAILWTVRGAPGALVSAPVVFVGFGIVAPEYGWDDYGDVDVRGKVVLALAGDPPSPPDDPDRFEGFALSPYGRWDYKLAEAARRGAAAAFLIHSDSGAGYPWNVVRASWTGEQLYPAPHAGAPMPPEAIEGWLRADAARFVLAAADLSLDSLAYRAAGRDFSPVATRLTFDARAHGTGRRLETANVIGILPGSDPALRAEAVVLTAHYDHLGIGPASEGDSIYNGAYDNASGVAVLLELASAAGSLRPAPRRSLVFIATAAEEAGQLGAHQYIRQPAFPLGRTAAAINLDGANLWGETADIGAVGAERSSLGLLAENRARHLGLRLAPERAADRGLFFRSDQFPFARAGIPAILIQHGLDFVGKPAGWGASVMTRYEIERYHRPGDRYEPDFDFAGAVQQARFTFLIALDVAAADSLPRLTGGSGFPNTRNVSRLRTPSAGRGTPMADRSALPDAPPAPSRPRPPSPSARRSRD